MANMEIPFIRLKRFWCWILTGHIWNKTNSNKLMSREMNQCIYCLIIKAGPD
jgi:hypothetical protein